jgi:nitroreductase
MTISIDKSIEQEKEDTTTTRQSPYKINPLILHRWSPRSMTGEELDDDTIMSLFEAARWAPSSYNNQPWRFIYAKRNTSHWDKLFNLLAEPNKVWTKNATVLIVVIARKNFEHNEKYSITHQFDAGAAWENLALEASSRGLAVHAMQGFDYERARNHLEIPDNFDVMAMIAIGRRGPKDNLPPQLHEREHPNDRKLPTSLMILGRRSLIGWPSGTSIDSQDTLSFSVISGVRSMNEVFPLERAAEAYELMMSGKVRFRAVLTTGN